MHKYISAVITSLFLSLPTQAAEEKKPLEEFTRAISIIEQTQLQIFTSEKPLTTKDIKAELTLSLIHI